MTDEEREELRKIIQAEVQAEVQRAERRRQLGARLPRTLADVYTEKKQTERAERLIHALERGGAPPPLRIPAGNRWSDAQWATVFVWYDLVGRDVCATLQELAEMIDRPYTTVRNKHAEYIEKMAAKKEV